MLRTYESDSGHVDAGFGVGRRGRAPLSGVRRRLARCGREER